MNARIVVCRFLAVALFLFIVSRASFAQAPGTGTYPYETPDSYGFDSINPGNLNVHLSIPIVNKQGRGLPFEYSLVFDSLIWTPVTSGTSTVWTPDPSFGLHGYLLNEGYKGFLAFSYVAPRCTENGITTFAPVYSNFVYHDEFGARHAFAFKVNDCTGVITGNGSSSDGSGFSVDGSFVVHSRSGVALNLPLYANGAVSSSTGAITDSNGNQVINNQNGTFTDTTGLTPLTITGSGTASSPRVFTYRTTTGTATVTLSYKTYTVQTNFTCSGVSQYGPKSVDLPDKITLADNSYYNFGYEATPGFAGNVTGRLASMRLPTGGTIYYAYSGGSNGIVCSDGTTAALTRSDSISTDGSVGYVRSSISSTHSHTEVTGPHGDQTEIDYALSGGVPYETTRSVHSGNSSGPQLAKTDTCYNGVVPPNCTNQSLTLPVTQLSLYRTLGTVENGFDMHFNTFGLTTDVEEYDYGTSGSNARGSVSRKTVYSYAVLGGYLVDRVAEVDVYDVPGTTLYSKSTYSYDTVAATPTSGLPNHVSVSGPRGNLQGIQSWFNSGGGLSFWSIGVDDAGQSNSMSDPKGNGTNYYYDSTDTFLTKVVQPTTTNGVPHISQSTYDTNSGLITSSIDQNSQTTSYHYDSMLRPSETDFPDGGKTTWTHSPTSTISSVLQQGTTNLNSETDLDALGRTSKTIAPDGSFTTYTYSPQQLQNCNSDPQPAGATSGAVYTCSTYDALGRVTGQSDPDGSSSSVSYADATQTLTDEAGRKRQLTYDGLSRLAQVGEPDTASTFNWITAYSYDPADRLLQVQQKGGSTNSSQWRTRTFTYDLAGRMLTRAEPESGTTTWAYTTDGTTLCSGDPTLPCSQTDARSVKWIYQYDALNRLIASASQTKSYGYLYDTTDGTNGVNGVGRLVDASNNANADEVYSYDQLGRIVYQASWTPSSPNNTSIVTRIGYDLAGEPTLLTYPDGRQLTQGFSAGRLSTITYSKFGSVSVSVPIISSSSLAYSSSGATYTQNQGTNLQLTQNLNSRYQVSGIQWKSGSTTIANRSYNWTTGSTPVDNGALWSITDNLTSGKSWSFNYDGLNRVSSAARTSPAFSQTFSYDAWGNMQQSGSFSFVQSYDANNRVSSGGFTLDAAGHITYDGSHHYGWNDDGLLDNVDSGTTAYIYDAASNRVRKNPTSGAWKEYVYLNGQVLAEKHSDGSWLDYIYANGQRIAQVVGTQTAAAQYRLTDHLGTLSMLVDPNGGTLATMDLAPFGQAVSDETTDTGKYTGLERDSESNTDHAQFRSFSSAQGRWLSPDPYMGSYDLTNPQSLNRYAYVTSNPLLFTDPSGLEDCLGCENGGGDGCDILGSCGCDSSLFSCGPWIPPLGDAPAPSPEFSGRYKNLDPSKVWTEQLGLPAGMKLNTGGILDIFGIDTGCEFGACGGGPMALGPTGVNVNTGAPIQFPDGYMYCGDFVCDPFGHQVGVANSKVTGLQEEPVLIFAGAGVAREAGEIGAEAAGEGVSSGFQYLFRPGSWLNQGQYWRIGFGRKGGLRVFRSVIFGWKKDWWTGGPL